MWWTIKHGSYLQFHSWWRSWMFLTGLSWHIHEFIREQRDFLRHNKIEKWCNKYKKAKNLLSRSIKKWVTKLRVVLGLCRHNFIMVVLQSRDSIIKALEGGQEEKETAKRKSHESNIKISLMWRYFIQFASGYFADYNNVSAFERAPVNDKNLLARKKQSFPFLESYLDKCLSMRFHW